MLKRRRRRRSHARWRFFLFIISKVLTKNNQRRREKTHVEQRVAVFAYLRNRRSDPENEGENEVSESRQDDERGELLQNTNTPIYTIVEHTLTLTRETNNKTRTNNVLFSILVYCPSWRRNCRKDGAADRRVKKENTEKS